MCELCTSQELEKAHKALALNGDTFSYYNQNLGLLYASSKKPTLWIKKLRSASSRTRKPALWIKKLRSASANTGYNPNSIKLRTASSRPCPEKEKAEKAMSLNYGF
jgi:hypothetical protein